MIKEIILIGVLTVAVAGNSNAGSFWEWFINQEPRPSQYVEHDNQIASSRNNGQGIDAEGDSNSQCTGGDQGGNNSGHDPEQGNQSNNNNSTNNQM